MKPNRSRVIRPSSRRKPNHRSRVDLKFWDVPLLIITLILLIIGVIMVFEASVVDAYQQFGDQFHFARLQLRWSVVGLLGMIAAGIVPFNWIRQYALPIFGVSIALLILVIIPGVGNRVGGASRWIHLGFMNIQPSEVSKLAVILYFAALFHKTPKFAPFIGSLALIAGLIMLQPDLGTTLVISGLAMSMYFLAGGPMKHVLGIAGLGASAALMLILSSSYRRARLFTFLDPEADPLGASYHIRQVIIALGSGGFWGTGIGRSLQKYRYLPEATTDSIFAVIGEELGFVGGMMLVGLFLFFAYRGFKIAKLVEDNFMKLTAAGITIMLVIQAFLNLAAMTALVPLTGITLPFISYGGSSLVISLAAVGLLLNISRYRGQDVGR